MCPVTTSSTTSHVLARHRTRACALTGLLHRELLPLGRSVGELCVTCNPTAHTQIVRERRRPLSLDLTIHMQNAVLFESFRCLGNKICAENVLLKVVLGVLFRVF